MDIEQQIGLDVPRICFPSEAIFVYEGRHIAIPLWTSELTPSENAWFWRHLWLHERQQKYLMDDDNIDFPRFILLEVIKPSFTICRLARERIVLSMMIIFEHAVDNDASAQQHGWPSGAT